MSRAGWALALLLAGGAQARPRPHSEGVVRTPDLPMRVVIEVRGEKLANCVFAVEPLAERLRVSPAVRSSFGTGDPLWGRCFLPGKLGENRPHELVDLVTIDGARAWEQAYDRAVAADAQSRLVPYGEVLRTLLAGLKPGPHRVRIDGVLRRGERRQKLYTGEFAYVR